MSLGDADGDGDLDLAAVHDHSGTVQICLNQGAGTFVDVTSTWSPTVASAPVAVAWLDILGRNGLVHGWLQAIGGNGPSLFSWAVAAASARVNTRLGVVFVSALSYYPGVALTTAQPWGRDSVMNSSAVAETAPSAGPQTNALSTAVW